MTGSHKKIGILGGLSPESTIAYYQQITRLYTERFGDYSYPEIVIYSVSFQPYVDWPKEDRWDLVAQGLGMAAQKLEAAGADFIIIATNTMHRVLDEIQAAVSIPILSLLDVVCQALQRGQIQTAGLLGTRFTMENGFYQRALGPHGLSILVPEAEDRDFVNSVIYAELVAGVIQPASRAGFVQVINRLAARGAEGIILGCTEIPLLIRETDVPIPLFDTTSLHAEAALKYALRG